MSVKPERIAAAARARQVALLGLLAARTDAIGESLARTHGMVAWDRHKTIGKLQRGLWALREQRFHGLGGPPARVCERKDQPLESLLIVSTLLRQGRRVHLEVQAGASAVVPELLAELRDELSREQAGEALTIGAAGEPAPDEAGAWERVGVTPARPRVAAVHADADRELAAYALALSGLRRGGADPRRIVQAFVAGPLERLERHLHRLWVGAAFGPPDDPEMFAGPVEPALAEVYRVALAAWSAVPGARVLCPGGQLERPGDPRTYLAPALLRAPPIEPPPAHAGAIGPLVVLHPCEPATLDAALAACRARGDVIQPLGPEAWRQRVGTPPMAPLQPLALGRLPPGLPEPRPT
ncbi:hypothetical protein [Nannocystis pusilla]|uniref:hypothetical protein n=1 Tax=Nannocystis pusilla TaxID=889268 RepID=UPI003BF27C68